MSRSGRKPWEEPISYNEDRFPDQPSRTLDEQVGGPIVKPDPDLVLGRDTPKKVSHSTPVAQAAGNRPSWRDGHAGRSSDDAPLNYNRGPHDRELDVDDRDELD